MQKEERERRLQIIKDKLCKDQLIMKDIMENDWDLAVELWSL